MFNTNVRVGQPKVTNSISIQSCAGGIYKSHPKSRIVRVYVNSERAKDMLSTNNEPNLDGKKVVVLQIINSVEGYLLVEYMYTEDYEAENIYFNPDGSSR